MLPKPPSPHCKGSTTPCTRAAATAASTAPPPARSTSAPASAASGWGATTMPVEGPALVTAASALDPGLVVRVLFGRRDPDVMNARAGDHRTADERDRDRHDELLVLEHLELLQQPIALVEV